MATRTEPPTSADLGPTPLPWSWVLGIFALMLPALLRAGFALDDRELLFENPVTDGRVSLWAAFGRDYFHHLGDSGQWRPLASLSLRLDRALFGTWSGGYHLVNGLLHLGVVVCAAEHFRRWRFPAPALRLGLVVFALHPVLADSVVWIAGRTSMLSALFPLAGALWARKALEQGHAVRAWVLAGVGLLLGLLSKEDALLFALFLPALGLSYSRRAAIQGAATAGIIVILWCLGRQLALGSPLPAATTPALGSAPLWERAIVGGQAWLEAFRLTLWPVNYPPQYRAEFLLARHDWLGSAKLSALLGWSLASAPFLWLAMRRSISPLVATCLLAVISFLPVTQLIPSGEVFAPRFLYLPLLCAIPLVGAVVGRLTQRVPLRASTFVVALLLAFGLYERGQIYQDQGAWRAEMLRHHPDDAPSWNALGLWREEAGEGDAAIDAWRHAIEVDPDYSRSWSNLGRFQLSRGELEEAESSLRTAIVAGPRNPIPRVNLATLLARRGAHADATQLYSEATRLSPGLSAAWRGLGIALEKQGRPAEARRALERALELDPGDRTAQTLLQRIERSGSPSIQAPHSVEEPESGFIQSNSESN